MALEIKPTSKWWYGRVQIGGKKMLVNLRVEIAGKRPASITQSGDALFERSRGQAMSAQDRVLEDLKSRHNAEELAQRIIQAKTGARFDTVKLDDLPAAWARLPRRRKSTVLYSQTALAVIERFVAFMKKSHPKVEELCEVTRQMSEEFLQTEESRGITAKTWNAGLSVLRSAFRHLQPEADAYRRHLMNLPGKEEETIHRQPFTPEEIQAILAAAKEDEQLFPVIVTALCTAMRKGDCCLLRWKDVDLKNGFITVKTGKTGERVEIPILPILNEVLMRSPGKGGEYVFPEAAALYNKSSDPLDKRLKLILAKAGFVDGDLAARIRRAPSAFLPVVSPEETRRLGLEAINAAQVMRHRRANMRNVFTAYMDGKVTSEISRELDVSKGTVSGHLQGIEKMIGVQVIRRSETQVPPAVFRGSIHADDNGGRLKRASVRGWHSFRTTWITLALSAGLPMELVRRVSGHTTTEVVLNHYFKPGREDFRRAIQAAMPKMLMAGGATNPRDEITAILNGTNSKTWARDSKRILELLPKV